MTQSANAVPYSTSKHPGQMAGVLRALRFAGFLSVALLTNVAHPQTTSITAHQTFSYSYATATRGCTQEDAPATEIFFTQAPFAGGDPPPPYLRFEISSTPSETLPRKVFALEGLRRQPGRQGRIVRGQWVAVGQPPIWLKGTLEIVHADAGQHLNGHFRVMMPDGGVAESNFAAKYFPHRAACGG